MPVSGPLFIHGEHNIKKRYLNNSAMIPDNIFTQVNHADETTMMLLIGRSSLANLYKSKYRIKGKRLRKGKNQKLFDFFQKHSIADYS